MGKAKGPVILFVIVVLGLVGWYFGKDLLHDQQQIDTSDAKNLDKIKIAGDGYLGYWFVNSPKMKIVGARKGIGVDFTDDGGAYAERLQKFNDGEYDAIMLPINSYIEHGLQYDYPGVIVAAISESKGADAIVGFGDVITNGKVNDLNDPTLKFVYTGQSPSSFLLDLTMYDFDFDQLRTADGWRKEVGSSEEVYEIAKKATKDRTKGDVFVMWEPEVSKAIEKLGMKAIWGSDKFAGYIVDVFVFNRSFVSKKPEVIQNFLDSYFRTLNYYSNNQPKMIKEMADFSDLDEDIIEKMVKKIDWFSLDENANEQFGINGQGNSSDKIISSIIACSNILDKTHTDVEFDADPYRLIKSGFIEDALKNGVRSLGQTGKSNSFEALSANQWADLNEVATMRIEPITFQRGSNSLDQFGEDILNQVSTILENNYPNYRVIIRGHTGPGDKEANQELSSKRAQAVLDNLINKHNLPKERFFAEGVGATKPLVRKNGESARSFKFRLARVEFILVEEDAL